MSSILKPFEASEPQDQKLKSNQSLEKGESESERDLVGLQASFFFCLSDQFQPFLFGADNFSSVAKLLLLNKEAFCGEVNYRDPATGVTVEQVFWASGHAAFRAVLMARLLFENSQLP